MPTNPTNNFSASSKLDPLSLYVEKFGHPFPRPLIVKTAVNFGGMEHLSQMLQQAVEKNKPVEDWSAFALELQTRMGLRKAAG